MIRDDNFTKNEKVNFAFQIHSMFYNTAPRSQLYIFSQKINPKTKLLKISYIRIHEE